jgi:hypothetical protein
MGAGTSLIETLKELGPWIISFLALVQVWAIAAWKRFCRPGQVEIHESGNIEIGYIGFGPTIALTGTLRSLNKDVFIKQLRLSVSRKKDSAHFRFSWRAFRPNTYSMVAEQPTTIELASSFLLTTSSPHKYNIVFVDDSFLAEFTPKLRTVANEWQEFIKKEFDTLEKQGQRPDYTHLQNPAFSEMLFDNYLKTESARSAFAVINNAFYWQAGEHELTLIVETSRPNKIFQQCWSFALSDQDIEHLRLNSVLVMRTTCGLAATYNFAYAEYGKAK